MESTTLEVVGKQHASPDIDRRARIIEQAKLALDGAAETRTRARLSIEAAIECGRLLIEEKQYNAGRGQWSAYFAAYYGAHIPERTARNWMALAVRAGQQPSLPDPNLMRNGMLALEMFPQKEHKDIPNNPKVVIHSNHLAIVNRFDVWYKHFRDMTEAEANPQYLRLLAKDFRSIIKFSKWLEGEVCNNAS